MKYIRSLPLLVLAAVVAIAQESPDKKPTYQIGVLHSQLSKKLCSKDGNCRREVLYTVDTPNASYSFVRYMPLDEKPVFFDRHSYLKFRLSDPFDYSAFFLQKDGKEYRVEATAMSEDQPLVQPAAK